MEQDKNQELQERLAAALSTYAPKDPKHPLADLPKDRLHDAIIWTLGDLTRATIVKHFAWGSDLTPQTIRSYLRDSRTVPTERLALIAHWAALTQTEPDTRYTDEIVNATNTPFLGWKATEQERYEMGYQLFISNLFGLTRIDLEKMKRLELIETALNCSTEELDALTAAARLMPRRYRDHFSDPIANNERMAMSEAALDVLPQLLKNIESYLPNLQEWAQSSIDWAEENKKKPLDIPIPFN